MLMHDRPSYSYNPAAPPPGETVKDSNLYGYGRFRTGDSEKYLS